MRGYIGSSILGFYPRLSITRGDSKLVEVMLSFKKDKIKNRDHHTIINYKNNYESLKKSVEHFSSNILEILHFEQKGISEKGIRSILTSIGNLRQNIFSNSAKNKEIFFKQNKVIERELLLKRKTWMKIKQNNENE